MEDILPNTNLLALFKEYLNKLKRPADFSPLDVSNFAKTMFIELHHHRYYFDGFYKSLNGTTVTVWKYYGVKTRKFSVLLFDEYCLKYHYRYE